MIRAGHPMSMLIINRILFFSARCKLDHNITELCGLKFEYTWQRFPLPPDFTIIRQIFGTRKNRI